MSPLKIYEYLAGGRPVVASDLPPMRDIDNRVCLVREGEDFLAGVKHALEVGPASEAQRMEFVRRNAWSKRHDSLLDLALSRSQ
jgi:hypothetical protein